MRKTNTRTHATEAQTKANRENAKRSTGPRTDVGKAASSRNGLKHGLCANKHMLPDEDPEEFLLLLKDLFDTFQPVGQAEERLVLRVAAAQWRLDRALPIETAIYRQRLLEVAEEDADQQRKFAWEKDLAQVQGRPQPPAPSPHDEGDRLARAFDADCVAPNSLGKLARYEGALERSIDRCLRQLKAFQAARLNQPGPRTPPVPPNSEDYGANPNSGGDPAEDLVEVLHLAEDIGRPGARLQVPRFEPANPVQWTPAAGVRFSAPGGTGFSPSSPR